MHFPAVQCSVEKNHSKFLRVTETTWHEWWAVVHVIFLTACAKICSDSDSGSDMSESTVCTLATVSFKKQQGSDKDLPVSDAPECQM